jgi:hypothetical protein
MKATACWLGALLSATLLVSTASAQAPSCYLPIPRAPDACGRGSYCVNACGQVYGPNYNVYPPFPPFQGMVFAPSCPAGNSPLFPTWPFARSPRDYFMICEGSVP